MALGRIQRAHFSRLQGERRAHRVLEDAVENHAGLGADAHHRAAAVRENELRPVVAQAVAERQVGGFDHQGVVLVGGQVRHHRRPEPIHLGEVGLAARLDPDELSREVGMGHDEDEAVGHRARHRDVAVGEHQRAGQGQARALFARARADPGRNDVMVEVHLEAAVPVLDAAGELVGAGPAGEAEMGTETTDLVLGLVLPVGLKGPVAGVVGAPQCVTVLAEKDGERDHRAEPAGAVRRARMIDREAERRSLIEALAQEQVDVVGVALAVPGEEVSGAQSGAQAERQRLADPPGEVEGDWITGVIRAQRREPAADSGHRKVPCAGIAGAARVALDVTVS